MNKIQFVVLFVLLFVTIYKYLGLSWKDAFYYGVTTQTSMGPETMLTRHENVNKDKLLFIQTLQNMGIIYFMFI